MQTRPIQRRTLMSTAAAAALLSATRPVFAQSAPKRGGDVVMAQQAQPPSLDAMTTFAQASRNITMHMFETLYTRGETGAVITGLASGCDASPDFKTFT